jgi:hypothetical protein
MQNKKDSRISLVGGSGLGFFHVLGQNGNNDHLNTQPCNIGSKSLTHQSVIKEGTGVDRCQQVLSQVLTTRQKILG